MGVVVLIHIVSALSDHICPAVHAHCRSPCGGEWSSDCSLHIRVAVVFLVLLPTGVRLLPLAACRRRCRRASTPQTWRRVIATPEAGTAAVRRRQCAVTGPIIAFQAVIPT
jgi:hypothetical protein